MSEIKNRSLAELESLYKGKLKHWTDQRLGYLKQAQECEQKMRAYDQKLRHIQALVDPNAAAKAPPILSVATGKPKSGTKYRDTPLRRATLQVMRDRPGQKLTARQIRTLIRKDHSKRCSRQTVNNNVNVLEEQGKIMRERAPKGTGSQFVFWAV